ncbi:hypothetical protein MACH09_14320 [Vibrio sp. MACH09]|uniref:hypothetical protein n=1 Tax=Vibrio sp. MACH09 TaxID=3025122 RepID=UPI00279387FB|nr:hypothetical protein [Vibrio sp. MACH09]GLO60924.1 hypothetical protein MACH09_14320 [Vibrio sp. MACH09]
MENENKAEIIAKSVEKISDSKGLAAIGESLPLVAMFLFIPLLMLATKWDGKLHEEKQCYQLKVINKQKYILNTCTGELEKIQDEILEIEKSGVKK